MEKLEFLKQPVLSSGLIRGLNLGFVKTLIEIKMPLKTPEDVTFQDFLEYASGKIKRGLKYMSLHKRVMTLMVDIFSQNDPEDVRIFEKCLPSEKEIVY